MFYFFVSFDDAKLQQFSHISKYFLLKSVKRYVKSCLAFLILTKVLWVCYRFLTTGFQHFRNTFILSLGEKVYYVIHINRYFFNHGELAVAG